MTEEKGLILVGAGGHARVLLDIIQACRVPFKGFIALDRPAGEQVLGFPVLGGNEIVETYAPDQVILANGVGTINTFSRRKDVFESFKKAGYSFATLIHPSAIVSPHSRLAEGVQIMAGCVIQSGVTIGENSIVNTRASLDHDCIIGKHVHIAPGVTLSGDVKIGDGAHIGTGATIIQGIRIGHGSMVGAGASVVRDVGDRQLVLGVPARWAKDLDDGKGGRPK